MKEIWKDVLGFEGIYKVSSLGNIKNIKRKRLLGKHLNTGGYQHAVLSKQGKRTYCRVHRLIAQTFLGHSNGLHVNHKNGIKTDNRVENLEWITPKENSLHATRILRPRRRQKGEQNSGARLSVEDVRQIKQLLSNGELSQTEIGKRFDVAISTIGRISRAEQWGHLLSKEERTLHFIKGLSKLSYQLKVSLEGQSLKLVELNTDHTLNIDSKKINDDYYLDILIKAP